MPHPPPARSRWSTVAVLAALLVWVGGVYLHVLGTFGPVVGGLGVVAGIVASVREQRTAWRVTVACAVLASLTAVTIYALVLTSTVSWPPSGW